MIKTIVNCNTSNRMSIGRLCCICGKAFDIPNSYAIDVICPHCCETLKKIVLNYKE